tara:strand:+ start:422 stop:661 length:240 start_codon:yes stop_codon:yes gene_type:complete
MAKVQKNPRVEKRYTDSFGDGYSIVTTLRAVDDMHRLYIGAVCGDEQTKLSITPDQALEIRKQLSRFLRATGHLPIKGE